jgi:hypothetical protein
MGAANIQRLRSDKQRPETVATQALVGAPSPRPRHGSLESLELRDPETFRGLIKAGPQFDAIYFPDLPKSLMQCNRSILFLGHNRSSILVQVLQVSVYLGRCTILQVHGSVSVCSNVILAFE